jgi:hypothetical protein
VINYSAILNSHTLQFTTASTKSPQSAVFTGCHLVAALNVVDSSASMFHGSGPRGLAPVSQLLLYYLKALIRARYIASGRTAQKTVTLLMCVTWCHVFQCSVTVRLVSDRMENAASTALPFMMSPLAETHPSRHCQTTGVFKAVPKQRLSLLVLQLWLSADMLHCFVLKAIRPK